jgi:nitroreductase
VSNPASRAGLVARFKATRFYERLQYPLNCYRLCRNYVYDARRFLRHSNLRALPRTPRQYQAIVTKEYHRLEKGMALPQPRPLFGQDVIASILHLLRAKRATLGYGAAGHAAINVLHEYTIFHEALPERSHPYVQSVQAAIGELRESDAYQGADAVREGGVHEVTRAGIHEKAKIDFASFAGTRHSVRQFSPEPVPMSTIEAAVRMAQKTPSVCNRQGWRVHVISGKADVPRALKHQNGNRGFTEQIDKVLIVTCSIEAFVRSGERNQMWIDGGMFSMSLIYALHSLGVGTCCLNWSADWFRDEALRRDVALPSSDAVIMMIAVGNLPESFRVCQSPKRALDEVLIAH